MLTRYDVQFGENSRMWEVIDIQTNGAIAWYEYPYDAGNHATDLNVVDEFEYEMAAYNADTY